MPSSEAARRNHDELIVQLAALIGSQAPSEYKIASGLLVGA